jgi:hypothetical protein
MERLGKCTEIGVMVILVFTSTEVDSILLQVRCKYKLLMKVVLLLRGIGYLFMVYVRTLSVVQTM